MTFQEGWASLPEKLSSKNWVYEMHLALVEPGMGWGGDIEGWPYSWNTPRGPAQQKGLPTTGDFGFLVPRCFACTLAVEDLCDIAMGWDDKMPVPESTRPSWCISLPCGCYVALFACNKAV